MSYSIKTLHLLVFHIFVSLLSRAQTILFQYPNSDRQIAILEERNDKKNVEELKRMDNQIRFALMKDMREKYTYGPMYFFEAKYADFIKNKEFDKVIFYNNEGQEIKPDLSKAELFVANISLFPAIEVENEDINGTATTSTSETHLGIGIILRTLDYEPLTNKMRFTPCKIYRAGPLFTPKKRYYVFKGGAAFNAKISKNKN